MFEKYNRISERSFTNMELPLRVYLTLLDELYCKLLNFPLWDQYYSLSIYMYRNIHTQQRHLLDDRGITLYVSNTSKT